MSKAIYPGTFDPITLGHIDVIERAARIFEQLIVAVGDNPAKKPFFSHRERLRMVRMATANVANAEVIGFHGLAVDFARKAGVSVFVRGIRTLSEFESELQMALTNRSFGGTDTVFVAPRPEYIFLNASLIKEIAALGGDVSGMVTADVATKLLSRFKRRRRE